MKEKSFFLTVIPGLEMTAYLELFEKWRLFSEFYNIPDEPEASLVKGGVEFKAPMEVGCLLNRFLKTPTRILLRLASFEAPNENRFRKEIKKVDWSLYFKEGDSFRLSFTSKSSKLSMKKQMENLVSEALKRLKSSQSKDGTHIFVRIYKDQCNISLDTTGERSQFRGLDKKVSMASLRESTAAGLLRILLQGVGEDFTLIDPMCGSGTFLSEGLSLYRPMGRKFAFESFPGFKGKGSEIEDKRTEFLKKVYGFDIHEKAVTLSKSNLKSFDSGLVQIEKKDLFSDDYDLESSSKRIVVINPPWGKRLPASSRDIIPVIEEKIKPDRIGLLMPAHWKMNSGSYEKVRDIPILNSGVENRFLVYVKS